MGKKRRAQADGGVWSAFSPTRGDRQGVNFACRRNLCGLGPAAAFTVSALRPERGGTPGINAAESGWPLARARPISVKVAGCPAGPRELQRCQSLLGRGQIPVLESLANLAHRLSEWPIGICKPLELAKR
jgi:hypothetical protein